jgi:hypothetical protein
MYNFILYPKNNARELRCADLCLVTYVLGQRVHPIFKGQTVQEDPLKLEGYVVPQRR